MKNDYPTIHLPKGISQALNAYPARLQFKEPMPAFPKVPLSQPPLWVIGLEIFAPLPLFLILTRLNPFLAVVLLGGYAIAIISLNSKWLRSYSQRFLRYQQQIQAFQQSLALYEQRRLQHEAQIQQQLVAHRQHLVQQQLTQTVLPEANPNPVNHQGGPTELEQQLKQFFGDKIQTQLKIKRPDTRSDYVLDLLWSDPKTGLCIAIEIDQPYSVDGKPLHCVSKNPRNRRDEFFLQQNWVVIHFAEEQVYRWPQSCCKFLAEIIGQLTNTPLSTEWLKVPDLVPIPKWSEAQVQQMWQQKYRESYLHDAG